VQPRWRRYSPGARDGAARDADEAMALRVSFETWAWKIWRPVMRDVRRQPGFKSLLLELGIVDHWRATGEWGDFGKPISGGNDFSCT